jgi:hypothetical protein
MKNRIFCTVTYIIIIFIRRNCYLTFYIKILLKNISKIIFKKKTKRFNTRIFILLLIFVFKFPSTENTFSLSVNVCWLLMIVHHINVALSVPSLLKSTYRSRKYRKIMHVEVSTQITHPFAEAEDKTLLLFVNVKQEKYDSSQSQ